MAYSNRPAENKKYSSVNLIATFICFDKVASMEQKKHMDKLRINLKALSRNPYKDLNERMFIAEEIYKLRCSTGCTITSDLKFL